MAEFIESGTDPNVVVEFEDGGALDRSPAKIAVIIDDLVFCSFIATVVKGKDASGKDCAVVKFIETSGAFNESMH